MNDPRSNRPALDDRALETVRQLYSEAQEWARHYEGLIVQANVLIISAALIFVGLGFGERVSALEARTLLVIPVLMCIVGLVLTRTLFNLYADCIERLIRLETLLGCFDPSPFDALDGKGPLLPKELMRLPVSQPTSVRFFLGLQALLLNAFVVLAAFRW